jgi:hypothetical protein
MHATVVVFSISVLLLHSKSEIGAISTCLMETAGYPSIFIGAFLDPAYLLFHHFPQALW